MNELQARWSASALTLISTTRSFEYFLVNSLRSPIESRHGGHHVAQKSSTTNFPERLASASLSPDAVVTSNSGANLSRARRGSWITDLAHALSGPSGARSR